ncbi:hypothetical protein [Caballeronia glathei]|uniref:Diguanylate cyclase n=1 Tax=Caballeronia glathei TaxID=60547 RepID=A0A069PAB7_9BURK|nr:hypothetical protein [Caballeronia glathei]KDR37595.1 hypothetical protein BG61_11525 [Caballeronia glathei]
MSPELLQSFLLFFVLPLWIVGGIADAICHRRSDIAHTAGTKESLMHFAQLLEMGFAVLLALFLRINALVILIMFAMWVLHQVTTYWDLKYASRTRGIGPTEQMVHSVLEMTPLFALAVICIAHRDELLPLVASGRMPAFSLAWKDPPLPASTIAGVICAFAVLGAGPYLLEIAACLRVSRDSGKGGTAERRRAP